ncbi:Bardet-Biedl syndrome 8 protein [Trypanosoma cruzi]|nr:Bardet-Biedl syndrome 8 protein [Trypanosoma cruzi]
MTFHLYVCIYVFMCIYHRNVWSVMGVLFFFFFFFFGLFVVRGVIFNCPNPPSSVSGLGGEKGGGRSPTRRQRRKLYIYIYIYIYIREGQNSIRPAVDRCGDSMMHRNIHGGTTTATIANTDSALLSPPPHTTVPPLPAGMDPTYYALSLLRRRRLEECIAVSTQYLAVFNEKMRLTSSMSQKQADGVDEPLWFIQTRALITQDWFDELDVDNDGVDEVLLDGEQNISSTAHRPGTSLQRKDAPTGTTIPTGMAQRQGTARPISSRYGYVRPGTQSRNRPGTMSIRPITSRMMRIGTASLQAVPGGPHIDVRNLNLEKYGRANPIVARILCDFLLHVEHRPRMVLELGAIALEQQPKDWWWMSRMGQAYYRLGLLREAERMFKGALTIQENVADVMRLAKVFTKMDQPLKALDLLSEASKKNPMDHHLLLHMARLYDQLQDAEKSCQLYRRVLQLDSSNMESIACIAAYMFYEKKQPEIALRLYRRLLQMGVQTTELWNNLGLCCFYSSQYDIALSCLQRAVAISTEDETLADVWYNIGHIGIGTGDLGLAHRAFKVALGANPRHAEALNNLAVLNLNIGQVDQAMNDLAMAIEVSPEQHEPLYNFALLAFKAGNFEKAYKLLTQALEACPDHPESALLQATLRKSLATL